MKAIRPPLAKMRAFWLQPTLAARIVGFLGIAIIFLFTLAGCESSGNAEIVMRHQWVMMAGALLSIDREQPFTSAQLAALLGDPEQRLAVTDYFLLLEQDGNKDELEYSEVAIHKALSRYLSRSKHVGDAALSDRVSEEVGRCHVWLYGWDDPEEVRRAVVGGLVVRTIVAKWSYVYLIYDSHVIDAHHIIRRRQQVQETKEVESMQP